MESKMPTMIGMITGYLANIVTGDIGTALITAFATGIIAYIGQQVAKSVHTKFKKK